MDDMSRNSAKRICEAVDERGGGRVLGLDVGGSCSWASYLVIATATSRVHMRGLASAVREAMREADIEPRSGGKKTDEGPWWIIDGGSVVVSLMEADARDFYALEERWFESEVFYRGD